MPNPHPCQTLWTGASCACGARSVTRAPSVALPEANTYMSAGPQSERCWPQPPELAAPAPFPILLSLLPLFHAIPPQRFPNYEVLLSLLPLFHTIPPQDAVDRGLLRTDISRVRGLPCLPVILITSLEIASAMAYLHARYA